MGGVRAAILAGGLTALLVGGCSAVPIPPALGGPTVTCEDPPAVTITDASGRESKLPVRLTCGPAVAAARATVGAIAIGSIEFRYGIYCPAMESCPFAGPDRAHVIFHTPRAGDDVIVPLWIDGGGVLHTDPALKVTSEP